MTKRIIRVHAFYKVGVYVVGFLTYPPKFSNLRLLLRLNVPLVCLETSLSTGCSPKYGFHGITILFKTFLKNIYAFKFSKSAAFVVPECLLVLRDFKIHGVIYIHFLSALLVAG